MGRNILIAVRLEAFHDDARLTFSALCDILNTNRWLWDKKTCPAYKNTKQGKYMILSAEKISKYYGEKTLIHEISLGIAEGDKIGLIGVNGAGKTTLLKILAGVESYDAGNIIFSADAKIEYLPQNPDFKSGTSILEHIFKGSSPVMELIREYEYTLANSKENPGDKQFEKKLIELTHKMDSTDAWSVEYEAKSILTKLGITDFRADVGTLSGGQRKRIAIAGALITPADLLILDEPTNHIDHEAVEWLETYLKKRKGALLMVTHDRYLLDRVVNRMIELDNGKLYSYESNYSKYLELKAEREELAQASERKRQSLIRRELEWIKRGAKARSTKQKARIQRFEKLTEQKGIIENEEIELKTSFSRLGKKIIEAKNIIIGFFGETLIKNFSYTILRDDRIGLIGPNGIGKSTLMKVMAGILKPDEGEVSIGETVKIGYFSQDNDSMDHSDLRVIEYLREKAELINTDEGSFTASQMLEKFLFSQNDQWTPVSKLSGGEKRRLHLLEVLIGAPNVLMLDEPTNDLDIQTLTVLEEYLEDFPGAVMVISHDRYFLDKVTDELFAFEGDGVINRYTGNYSDYIQQIKDREEKTESVPLKKANDKENRKPEKVHNRPLKFSFKEQREFEQIDDLIAKLEDDVKALEKKISEASSDFVTLQRLMAEKVELDGQLEQAISRWTYLTELSEEMEKNKKKE